MKSTKVLVFFSRLPSSYQAIALVLAAADMGDGVDEASVHQGKAVGVERSRDGDAVGAVAVKQAWRGAVYRRVAVMDERDRHQFAIMRQAPSVGA